jgi:hypothetical protein
MKNHFLIRAYCEKGDAIKGEVEENHPLKTLLQKLPQNYSMQGRTNLFKDAKIFLKRETEEMDCGTLGSPNVLKLLEAATSSPFGKGAETVFDENVRKGKEIKAEKIKIQLPSGVTSEPPMKRGKFGWGAHDETQKSFTELLCDMILENNDGNFLGPNIDIQFYKLAIYEPGGHFQTHRDTVHSADHKATLLLEVRSDHKGGVLTLQKNDLTTEWNLTVSPHVEDNQQEVLVHDPSEIFNVPSSSDEEEGKTGKQPNKKQDRYYYHYDEDEHYTILPRETKPRRRTVDVFQQNKKDSLSWILFYTDIEHSVSPVTEGTRVVLQFDVYDQSTHADAQSNKSKKENNRNSNRSIFQMSNPVEFDELITANSSMIAPMISILQKGLTSKHALAIPLYYLYTSQSILPEKLKTIDKELFQSLLGVGFPVALVPIELVVTTDEEGSYSGGRKKMLIHDFPFQVYENGSSAPKTMTKVPEDFKFTYVVSGLEATKLLEHRSYVECTGNESADGKNRYLCGAMIVFKQRK